MPDRNTLEQTLQRARQKLAGANVETAALDARLLLQFVLKVQAEDIITDGRRILLPEEEALYALFIEKRCEGVPVSKITGIKEFYGRDFIVSKDVLDPRPDTETLIDAVLGYVQGHPEKESWSILDLGTGSGCILITLLQELPHAQGVGVDISEKALEIGTANLKKHQLESRGQLKLGCWGEAVDGQFDIIVSNPPYIAAKEIESLQPEVQNHDPIQALDGGDDGLDPYKIIFPQLHTLIHPQGMAFFEIGWQQREDIQRIADISRVVVNQVVQDIAGRDRVVVISTGKK